MFKAISIFDDDYYITHKNVILDYCKKAFEEKEEPSHANMYADDWENDPSTLPYLLYKSNRFTDGNGDMFVLLNDDQISGISGVNVSDFDKNVALGGVRTWLNKELRGKFLIGKYLLPKQLAWAKQNNLKIITITLNDYNKRLLPYFKREGLGIAKNRTPESMFYNGQYTVDFPVTINYTKQWVLYHKIDENYEVNWECIRYHDK